MDLQEQTAKPAQTFISVRRPRGLPAAWTPRNEGAAPARSRSSLI